MKILRLTTLLDFGGQERQYVYFTADKTLLHNDYVFAAIGYGGNAEKILRERGFDVYCLNLNPAIRNLKNILALYRLIRKIKPDVVHTAAAEANFHGVVAARLAGVKTVFAEEIGIPRHSRAAQLIFRQIYRLTNGVICISNAVKDFLIKTGEIAERQGIVIYNPVGEPEKIVKKTSAEFNIVYAGRLEAVKNVGLLLQAFAKANDNETMRLTVVGDGRERQALENEAARLGIDDRTRFVGFADRPEQYVSQADLFVLPSLTEGFGIAAVEAMYQAVPCLCTNVGGIPEFIEDGENGWLFSPSSVSELTDKINNIRALSSEERVAVGVRGRESVVNRFSIKTYVERLEEVYEKK